MLDTLPCGQFIERWHWVHNSEVVKVLCFSRGCEDIQHFFHGQSPKVQADSGLKDAEELSVVRNTTDVKIFFVPFFFCIVTQYKKSFIYID